mgnify:CR=1 FL=1
MGSGRKRRLDRQWRGYAMAAALALLGVGLPAALRRRHVAQIPEENPDPVLRISRDGTVLYSNAMGLKKLYELGWHPKQVVPMHFRSLVRDACEAGGYIEEEVELGEGEVFSFSVSEVAQEGYINLYGRDITERRRAEQARLAGMTFGQRHDHLLGGQPARLRCHLNRRSGHRDGPNLRCL